MALQSTVGRAFPLILIILATSTCGFAGLLEVQHESVPILFLRTDRDVYPLGPYLEILADPEKKLRLEDVTSSRYAGAFRPVDQKTLHLGLSKSSYWLRFKIASQAGTSEEKSRMGSQEKWLLDIGVHFGPLFCHLYSPVPVRLEKPEGLREEKGFFVQRAVEPSLLEPNEPLRRLLVFALPQPSEKPEVFYLRIEGSRSLYLPMKVTTRTAYLHMARNKMYFFGICLGVLLGLIVYNLSMYFILKDNAYFFFVLKMVSMALLNTGVVAGLTMEWFPYLERRFLSNINFSIGIMAEVTSVIFVKSYFMTSRYNPVINRIFNILITIHLIMLPILFMIPLQDVARLHSPIYLVQNCIIFITILAGLHRGFWPARYYLAGYIIWTLGLWSFWLIYVGILPYFNYGVVLVQIGTISEALFFTLAVFNRLIYFRQEKEDAERQARREELAKLLYQIRPHFLLNSLNSISGAMLTQIPVAQKMVGNLAEFFRMTLVQGQASLTTVRSELELAKIYIEIEQCRHGEDYLKFDVHLDSEIAAVAIPPFLLQPLVENAVKHGSRTSPEALEIRITAQRRGQGRLYLEVANTGAWVESQTTRDDRSTRIGLENLLQRLSKMFPDKYDFLVTKENGWVTIGIEFPVLSVPTAPA